MGMSGGMMPPVTGGLGALPRMPRIHMPRSIRGSKVPPPPRIQLVDLGGSAARRLGVGLNIGMTGHHHHYKPSLNELSLLASEGATKNQFKTAWDLTKVGMKEEKREERDKRYAKEEQAKKMNIGFNGFKGYDGFGSGYYDDTKGKKKKQKGD